MMSECDNQMCGIQGLTNDTWDTCDTSCKQPSNTNN